MNLPSNFTLKTGFNPLIENKVNQEFVATIMSMVTIFSEEAMVLASNYTLYNGRDEVTTNDLIKALKYRALDNNPEYWEKPEIITKMRTIYNEYINENNDIDNQDDNQDYDEMEEDDNQDYDEMEEDDNQDYDEMEEDDNQDYDEMEEDDNQDYDEMEEDDNQDYDEMEEDDYQYLDVSQTVLDKMNDIEEKWNRFEPTENSELILKRAIDNTERRFPH